MFRTPKIASTVTTALTAKNGASFFRNARTFSSFQRAYSSAVMESSSGSAVRDMARESLPVAGRPANRFGS